MTPRSPRPASILFPEGPHAMRPRIADALQNPDLRRFVPATTLLKDKTRADALGKTFGDPPSNLALPGTPRPERVDMLRRIASETRRETLAHLDAWLATYTANATRQGIIVHRAKDAAEARAIVLDIAKAASAKTAVKAKSMVTEECQLLDALLDAGIDTLETDLGELVLQLDDDAPSHIVSPMIHKDREAAARALARLETEPPFSLPSDPETLVAHARHHLRARFANADLGITGANFLVAETGEIVTCTNEGNGRLTTLAPRVHIAITGIEKVVADLDHLSLLLELLARSSTGQPLTVYTSFTSGPGPGREVHLILLDNGRSSVLKDPRYSDALGCIRCGACLNACPVYRTIGGHAYGSVWPGPIGQVLTPLLRGPNESPDLPWASTLCGACRDACPVDIDLPGMLVSLRSDALSQKRLPRKLRLTLKLARFAMKGRFRWRLAETLANALIARDKGPAKAFAHGERRLPKTSDRPFTHTWKQLVQARKKRARDLAP